MHEKLKQNDTRKITGERLRELRKKHGMLQSEVGEVINVGKSAIAGYESGFRNPKKSSLPVLAELFHTSVDYLLGLTDNPERYSKDKEPKDLKKLITTEDFTYEGKPLTDKDIQVIISIMENLADRK